VEGDPKREEEMLAQRRRGKVAGRKKTGLISGPEKRGEGGKWTDLKTTAA